LPRLLVYQIGAKIRKQMTTRGWTTPDIEEVLSHPARTVRTQDRRYLPDGTRMDDPGTAYLRQDGHYVVRNDRTGDIVQISNRRDPFWKSPF
jgi:colicin-like ribonuclease protein